MAGGPREELITNLEAQIGAAQAAAGALDDAFADYIGVNRTDARCLEVLSRDGPLAAGDLARSVRLTTGAVTAVLDRLEAVGYVRRKRDTDDRRKVLVEVTPRFRRLAADAYETAGAALEQIVAPFGDRELERLAEFHERRREADAERLERLRQKVERRARRASAARGRRA